MVSAKSVQKQLKRLNFSPKSWGRAEVNELSKILLPDEEIYELANGVYENGVALLVATNFRLLLVDKKPLNFLNVEDLRFDMINEIDYSHRLMGASICVTTGNKTLNFRSLNQARLRKLIGHVQHCMADTKKQQNSHQSNQNQHLEQINQQLQAYLLAQHQQQVKLQEQLQKFQEDIAAGRHPAMPHVEPVKPDNALSDYLLAQSLLARHQAGVQDSGSADQLVKPASPDKPKSTPTPQGAKKELLSAADSDKLPAGEAELALPAQTSAPPNEQRPLLEIQNADLADLRAAGLQEVFGRRATDQSALVEETNSATSTSSDYGKPSLKVKGIEVHPLRIAYAMLPVALRHRKFGRPFRAPSARFTPARAAKG